MFDKLARRSLKSQSKSVVKQNQCSSGLLYFRHSLVDCSRANMHVINCAQFDPLLCYSLVTLMLLCVTLNNVTLIEKGN